MTPLEAAFDPERFRRDGHAVIDLLTGLLADAQARRGAVLPPVDPAGELAHWRRRMAEPPGELVAFLREFAARSIQLHHPRYVGHQVCAPAPEAALAGLASELLNNAMGVYEMGPAANALERWVVEATAGLLGWPAGAGFLPAGGPRATLTALLAA
ncbi:MAG: pyridoxal-dependent decarboxylase, partial [Opitutaceae bacterium]